MIIVCDCIVPNRGILPGNWVLDILMSSVDDIINGCVSRVDLIPNISRIFGN